MHLTVFKTYAKELNLLQCQESDLAQDRRVVQVLRDGLQLFMGSSGDETLRTNWKMHCHLMQAYSAYMQSTVTLFKKRTQIDHCVVLELLACSETVFCPARYEGLKSKLTEAQLNNVYTGVVEGLLSVAFEAESQPIHTSAEQQQLNAAAERCLASALQGNAMICTYFSNMLNSVLRYARVKGATKTQVRAATERLFAFLQTTINPATTSTKSIGRCKHKPVPAPGQTCPAATPPHAGEYCCCTTELCSAALLVLECAVSTDMNWSADELASMWYTVLSVCSASFTDEATDVSATATVQLVAGLAGALCGGKQSRGDGTHTLTVIARRVQEVIAQYLGADSPSAKFLPLSVLELVCSVPLFVIIYWTGLPAAETEDGVEYLFHQLSESLALLCSAAPAKGDGTIAGTQQQRRTAMSSFLCRAVSNSVTVLAVALKADKTVFTDRALRFVTSAGEWLLPPQKHCDSEHNTSQHITGESIMLVRTVRSVYSLLAQVDTKCVPAAAIRRTGGVLMRLLQVAHSCTPALSTGDLSSICVIFARCCALPVVPAVSLSAEAVLEESSALECVVGALSLSISLFVDNEPARGGFPGGHTKDLAPALSKALAALVLRHSLQAHGSSMEGERDARLTTVLSGLNCLLPHPKLVLLAAFNCKIVHAAASEMGVCVDTLIHCVATVNKHLSSADVLSLILHLKSHLHFSGQRALNRIDQDLIEAQIREQLSMLDSSEFETTLAAPTKYNNKITGRTKKAAAETIALSQDAAVQLIQCAEALRCWCLLCAWTDHGAIQQRGAENVDNSGESFTRDRPDPESPSVLCCGKYVTSIVKLLKRLLPLMSLEQLARNDDGNAAARLAFSEVFVMLCRPLMAQLHMHGRTDDRDLLLRVGKALEICTKGELPEAVAAVQDLRTLANTDFVFSGVSTKAEWTTMALNFCSQDPAHPGGRAPSSTIVDQLVVACITLFQPVDSHIGEVGIQMDLPTSRDEFIALVKQAYSFAGVHRKKRSSDGIEATDFTPVICAMCCRVLFLCFQDLAGSLEWGAYACSGTSPESKSSRYGLSPWLGSNALLAQLAVLEVLLVRADVYEVLGNVDSALAYAKEAAEMSNKLHSPALQNVVSLHTLRLYHRTASPRLCSLVSDLLEQTEEIYSSEAVRNDITSKQVRSAAASIVERFSLASDEVQDCKVASVRGEAMKYRHLHLYWDMTGNDDAGTTRRPYNCPIPSSVRATLRAVLESADPIQFSKFSGISANCSEINVSSVRSLLVPLQAACAPVDVLRDLRRRFCAISLSSTAAGVNADPLLAFLAGASSCGVAIDRLLDNRQDSAEGPGITGEGHFSSIGKAAGTVCSSLLGDASCARLIEDKLQSMLQRSATDGGGHSTLAFACLEPASGALLLGRMDSGGSLVVALPVHQDMLCLLTKWDDTQEQSRAMLRQGVNVEQVAALTDKQKKSWWSARQQHDAGVEAMLSDLQDLLGPWRVLLSTEPVREELTKACAAAVKKYLSAEKGVTDFARWAGLLLSNTASDDNIATRTMPLSMKEANDGLSALLREVVPQLSEEQLLSLTQDLTAIVANMRACPTFTVSIQVPSTFSCSTEQTSAFAFTSDALNSLKVTELRSLLVQHGLVGAGKKQDLIDRMLEYQSQSLVQSVHAPAACSSSISDQVTDTGASKGHLVLILDEQLQRLPFESIPSLRQASCSRVPSLPLLLRLLESTRGDVTDDDGLVCRDLSTMKLSPVEITKSVKDAKKSTTSAKKSTVAASAASAAAAEKENTSPQAGPYSKNDHMTGRLWRHVAVDKCWYALDIEDNLPNTRTTLQPFLSPYEQKWHWQSVVGNIPSENRTQELHEASELFIFCGHGAGERMCDPFRFRRLRTCPAAMLWGCSSGRLKAAGVHDALGTAVYYLLAGAPFVVANLWDVTDKDIDKLCMTHMQLCFDGSGSGAYEGGDGINDSGGQETNDQSSEGMCNVSTALAMSRNVCRMQFAVGAAPVVYGIPAYVTQTGKLNK